MQALQEDVQSELLLNSLKDGSRGTLKTSEPRSRNNSVMEE